MADLKEQYRPQNFDDFFGNDDTIIVLESLLKKEGGPPPAILLTGPRGCGKTTLAGIIKNVLGIHDRDFKEMNTADDRGIDKIRDLKKMIAFPPHMGTRVVFMDECHRLTKEAQDALLKMIEIPPAHTRFVFATTDPQMLIAPFRSRCKIIEVELLNPAYTRDLINDILKREKIKDFPQKAIDLIVDLSEGSPREAIDLLDTAIACEDQRSMMSAIQKHKINEASVKDLCQALWKGASWKKVVEILKGISEDPESVRYAVLGYMSAILMNSGQKRAAEIMTEFMDTFMYTKKSGLVLACYMVAGSNK